MANTPLDLITLTDNFNNKLYCNAFPLIQPADSNKFVVGRTYRIYYKSGPKNNPTRVLVGTAVLKTSTQVPVAKLTDGMCYADTGYDAEATKRMIHRIWKGKVLVFFFGFFVWKDREPVSVPLRGEVGRAYKALKEREAQRKEANAQLSLIQEKHAGKSTLITGKNPTGGLDKDAPEEE